MTELKEKTAQQDKQGDEGFLELWGLARATGFDKWAMSFLAPNFKQAGLEPSDVVTGIHSFVSSPSPSDQRMDKVDSTVKEHTAQLLATHEVVSKLIEACEKRLGSLEANKRTTQDRLDKLETPKSESQKMFETEAMIKALKQDYIMCSRKSFPCCCVSWCF